MTKDSRITRFATILSTTFVMLGSVAVQAHPGPDHWHPESGAAMTTVIATGVGLGAIVLLRRALRQREISKATNRDA